MAKISEVASVGLHVARHGRFRLCRSIAAGAALIVSAVLPFEAAFSAENAPAGCPEGAPAGCPADTSPACPDNPPLDYKIVPNCRIGPVTLTAPVNKIVDILGPPTRQLRDTYRDRDTDSDVITYVYRQHCLTFSWIDKGLRPKPAKAVIKKVDVTQGGQTQKVLALQDRYLAIKVTCWRTASGASWQTEEGLHVGNTIDEVLVALKTPDFEANCKTDRPECIFAYTSGIWFRTKNRKSPVSEISVIEKFTR